MEVTLKLTAYECHLLLKELEDSLRICNRNGDYAKFLWEKISTQLNGTEMVLDIVKKDDKSEKK